MPFKYNMKNDNKKNVFALLQNKILLTLVDFHQRNKLIAVTDK